MKKTLYSLLALSFVLFGCARFEDFKSEDLGKGSNIAIDVSLVTDSTFMLSLSPSEGASHYSYVVEKGTEPTTHDAYDLLKGKYKGVVGKVLETATDPTFSSNLRDADGKPLLVPNTVYQIYAVAATKEGIAGEVVSVTVTTSDGVQPGVSSFKATDKNVDLTLTEGVIRSTGAITATYYKEFDLMNPIVVEVPNDSILIKDAVVTVMPPDVNSGAFVTVSLEAGAFKDIYGNPSKAVTSSLNTSTGKFTGIYYRAATKEFEIKDSYFVSPEDGSFFTDWLAFEGVVEFTSNIYRKGGTSAPKLGDIKAIYSNKNKKAYMSLASTHWSVASNKLTFKLPSAPAFGDNIGVVIGKAIIFDVWGNPNAAYTKEESKWSLFEPSLDIITGEFSLDGVSTGDGKNYNYGAGTIEEDTSTPNSLILKDFVFEGFVMSGTYDLTTSQMFLVNFDSLGNAILGNGKEYEFYNYNFVDEDKELIPFAINPDGTMSSSEYGIAAYDIAAGELFLYDTMDPSVFTKIPQAGNPTMSKKNKLPASVKSANYRLVPINDIKLQFKILKKINKR